MKTERQKDDARLRALLKRFDPAAGDEGLPAADRARMRRAIVDAAEARPGARARWLVPAVAATAAVLLALWIGTRGGREANGPTRVEVQPPATHAQASTPVPDSNSHPAETNRAQTATPVVAVRSVPKRPTKRVPRNAATESAAVAQNAAPRSIHFVTSSGTQIIWTLDPQLDI